MPSGRFLALNLMLALVAGLGLLTCGSHAWAQESPGNSRAQVHERKQGQAAAKEAEGADETEQFKQSPSVRAIARTLGLDVHKAYWLSVGLNFAIVALAIFFLAKMRLPTIFRNRTESISKAMAEARQASEEAQRRLAEIEARLGKMDSEIGAMRAAAETDSAAEEQRLRAAAEEDKKKIVEAAEQEIAAAAKAARRELTAHAADLAVTLARKRISVDESTDQQLVRGFADQLGAGKDGN